VKSALLGLVRGGRGLEAGNGCERVVDALGRLAAAELAAAEALSALGEGDLAGVAPVVAHPLVARGTPLRALQPNLPHVLADGLP